MSGPSSPPAPVPRARKIERPRRLTWRHHLAALLMFAGLRALAWTWRLRLVDEHGILRRTNGPFIACLWHNRLALSAHLWERVGRVHSRSEGMVALISASHDGGMLARVLGYFGVEAVRGSSSRRGAQALLELTSWTARGYSITITPDGPRGPSYEIHDGIIALAQLSGLPIWPVSTSVRWKIRMRSWDRFQVPLPFARCVVKLGEPLVVPREATEEERAALRVELRRRMMVLTED